MLPAEVWSWDCLMLKCQSLHSVTNIRHYRCQTFIHLFWNKSRHWDPAVIQEIVKHNGAQQASFQAISAAQASHKMRALWWQPLSLCKLLFPHNSSFSRLFHPASSCISPMPIFCEESRQGPAAVARWAAFGLFQVLCLLFFKNTFEEPERWLSGWRQLDATWVRSPGPTWCKKRTPSCPLHAVVHAGAQTQINYFWKKNFSSFQ